MFSKTLVSVFFFIAFFYCSGIAQDLIPYRVDSLWGYSDAKGNIVIKPTYQRTDFYSQGLALVQKEGKYGYIDSKGQLMIDFRFDQATSFSSGVARVNVGSAASCINLKGEPAPCPGMRCPGAIGLHTNYQFMYSDSQTYIYKQYIHTDANGQRYPFKDTVFVCDKCIETNADCVLVMVDGKWGVLGTQGTIDVPLIYDEIKYRASFPGYYLFPYFIVSSGGKVGVIDLKGKPLTPIKYRDMQFVSSEFTRALMPDGLWAYVSTEGKEYYSATLK